MTLRTLSTGHIIGRHVSNREAEDLGKVEELLVDMTTGRISYAIISFGGLWGMGEKLFAVPWEALGWPGETDAIETFHLNVDREALENAPVFDWDHVPEHPDTRWLMESQQRYNATHH